jgi:sugar/nucleoside kinase (ribokinase family)
MDEKKCEVIGVGAATRDRFLLVEAFPVGEGVSEVLATAEDEGGPVATALAFLERQGRRCLLVDAAGDKAESVILVRRSDGARHILFGRGGGSEPGVAALRAEWFEGARLLHVNGRHEAVAREAVRLAHEAGVKVSFDGGAGRYRESIRDLVEASHVLIVAREFAERYAGVEGLLEAGALLGALPKAEVVVITDGVRGSWVRSRAGETFHQEAVAVAEVVDTTGCGDVYHGAFLHGLLSGWSLKECAVFASQWAAETAKGLGGRWAMRAAQSR